MMPGEDGQGEARDKQQEQIEEGSGDNDCQPRF